MRTKSDFWLTLHQLAGELHRESADDEQCFRQLAEHLEIQPQALRAVNCSNLEFTASIINRLVVYCRNGHNDAPPGNLSPVDHQRSGSLLSE